MPERIVDVLEMIQIDKENRQSPTVPLGECNAMFEAVIQEGTIRQ